MENKEFYKFLFAVKTTRQWYDIMAECRRLFGKEWTCQGKVRRKFERLKWAGDSANVDVWFEVPDSKFGVWVALKTGVVLIKEELKTSK